MRFQSSIKLCLDFEAPLSGLHRHHGIGKRRLDRQSFRNERKSNPVSLRPCTHKTSRAVDKPSGEQSLRVRWNDNFCRLGVDCNCGPRPATVRSRSFDPPRNFSVVLTRISSVSPKSERSDCLRVPVSMVGARALALGCLFPYGDGAWTVRNDPIA